MSDVAAQRFDIEGQPIPNNARTPLGRSADREQHIEAGPDETKKARRGIYAQIQEARTQAVISEDDASLLSAATLKEGEVLDANVLLGAAMNEAVSRSVQASSERLQAARMTPEQRLGREVALAIEQRVGELEAEQDEEPDWAAEADAQIAAEDEQTREVDESIAEITSAWEADRREQEAALAEEDEDDWLVDDEDD